MSIIRWLWHLCTFCVVQNIVTRIWRKWQSSPFNFHRTTSKLQCKIPFKWEVFTFFSLSACIFDTKEIFGDEKFQVKILSTPRKTLYTNFCLKLLLRSSAAYFLKLLKKQRNWILDLLLVNCASYKDHALLL